MKNPFDGKSMSISAATRGSILFLAGLGLTIREALVAGPDRPSLYILYAGMMGFPFVLKGVTGKDSNGNGTKS